MTFTDAKTQQEEEKKRVEVLERQLDKVTYELVRCFEQQLQPHEILGEQLGMPGMELSYNRVLYITFFGNPRPCYKYDPAGNLHFDRAALHNFRELYPRFLESYAARYSQKLGRLKSETKGLQQAIDHFLEDLPEDPVN